MNDSVQHVLFFSSQILIEYYCITSVYSNTVKQANVWLECFIIEIFCSSTCQRLYPSRNCSCFANELFSRRLVCRHLGSIRRRPGSLRRRPTGQFANVRYPVLTKKTLLIDVWNAILILGWSLGQEILSHCQFRFRLICMFLIVSLVGSWALHRSNFHGENWLLNTKVWWLPKVLQIPF